MSDLIQLADDLDCIKNFMEYEKRRQPNQYNNQYVYITLEHKGYNVTYTNLRATFEGETLEDCLHKLAEHIRKGFERSIWKP